MVDNDMTSLAIPVTGNPTKWKCISSEQVCDQVKDCPNRDDESVHLCSCPNEPDYFRCKGLKAKCIPPTWQCDNVQDCVHGDDEDVAKCLPQLHHNCLGADNETVYSGVRKTVPLAWKCDGELDCSKGDDEKFCPIPYPRANCSQGQYNCLESSTCIDAGLICNQIPDCPQLDDERDCKSAPEPENGLPNAIPPNTPFWRRSARQRPVFTAV
ncbi:Low-density lipoprotein receptor-related protein 2 [Halotydeus destructor]|nr:Low-density lipoprotein receptor-related protein 2 [Halotydeus destructor]